MKTICIIACSLATLAAAQADPPDNDQVLKAKRSQANQVQEQPGVVPKVRVHPTTPSTNGNVSARPNLSRAPFRGGVDANVNANTMRDSKARVQGQARTVRHFNFNAQPNPRVASVRFNASHRFDGSENWRGHSYDAFRNYHPQWHDSFWWRNHHARVILIGGGWYYWDAGFWYPAWGYDSVYSYYPYDGPIYAYGDLPPDQVIANVQSALEEEGYYTGEIDGLLGPLTRAALADYQRDHGLYVTAAIDQPTLASLGMD